MARVISAGARWRDDRGQPVVVLDASCFADWPIRTTPRLAELTRTMSAVLQQKSRDLVLLIGFSGGLVYVVAMMVFPYLFPQVPKWVLFTSALVAAMPVQRWLWKLPARRCARELADVVLREGLCPTCGYNLFGLDPVSDGCIVCPECGSAWRASRVVRAEPFAEVRASDDVDAVDHIRRLTRLALTESSGFTANDDAGRPVAIVHPRLRASLARSSGVDRERVREARRQISQIGRPVRVAVALVLMALGAGITAIMLSIRLNVASVPVGAFIGGLFFVALGVAVLFGNFGYRAGPMVRVMKRWGLCPACGQRLEGPRPLTELVTCGRCFAAWRLDED